ncbi:oxygenase MpaB family protein [Nocardiopsis ganjiahuensis]|uniref:oxygenase MpaB family protein n=1 Tax=Nocardiopsis ganjiahuensis TaxID=239984 RepID=UPI0003499346|nr:oxygenase MpaB family protein [Nocardiopsis ganjiahuensis]
MPMTYADFHRELKDLGDPKADAVVRELLDEGQVNAVNQLFRQISTADSPVPQQAPEVLREFMDSTRAFPDWMDPALISQASDFFRHHHLEASAMQATVGLVGTYLSPVGAYTLHSTHQLADNPHRRLSQSTRLFMGMGDRDAFTEHSKLVPTCQKVRLVHAAIRELHRRSGRWDYEGMGMPVSQLYTAGAALVFSVQVLEGMANLGRKVDPDEADGFSHAWMVIAYFLGVPEEYLLQFSSRGEAVELWQEGREKEWAPSEAGVILTRECVELYQREVAMDVPKLKEAVPAFIRAALTDRYADMVEIPRSSFDLGAKAATTLSKPLLGSPIAKNPVTDEVFGVLGKAVERVAREAFTRGQETEPQMTDRIS